MFIKVPTEKKSNGKNKKIFCILHHTATGNGTTKSVVNYLSSGKAEASAHFVIGEKGEIYKIGELDDILWHCGVSRWGNYRNLNAFSIGIEIVGPLAEGFTREQKESVKTIIDFLRKEILLKEENTIRHKDISPGRKIDVDDRLWSEEHDTWEEYRKTLFINEKQVTNSKKYLEDIRKAEVKNPVLKEHFGDELCTMQDARNLAEIVAQRKADQNTITLLETLTKLLKENQEKGLEIFKELIKAYKNKE